MSSQTPRPRRFPPLSDAGRAAILEAIRRIAGAAVEPRPEDADRVYELLTAALASRFELERLADELVALDDRLATLGGSVITTGLLDALGVQELRLVRRVSRPAEGERE